LQCLSAFFFQHPPPPTSIYTLSLHDALPILRHRPDLHPDPASRTVRIPGRPDMITLRPRRGRRLSTRRRTLAGLISLLLLAAGADRKSTRLNSSHSQISYAVFCLKKKKKINH